MLATDSLRALLQANPFAGIPINRQSESSSFVLIPAGTSRPLVHNGVVPGSSAMRQLVTNPGLRACFGVLTRSAYLVASFLRLSSSEFLLDSFRLCCSCKDCLSSSGTWWVVGCRCRSLAGSKPRSDFGLLQHNVDRVIGRDRTRMCCVTAILDNCSFADLSDVVADPFGKKSDSRRGCSIGPRPTTCLQPGRSPTAI